MKKVFISHSSADKAFVKTINDDLKSNGIETWVDEDVLALGDDLDLQIKKGIRRADVFILVLSNDSLKSEWVKNELNFYLNGKVSSKKRFIPVIYKECKDLPEFIFKYFHVDLSKLVRRVESGKIKFTNDKEYNTFLELLIKSIRQQTQTKVKGKVLKDDNVDSDSRIKIRFELVSDVTSLTSIRTEDGTLSIFPDNEIVPRLLYNQGSEEFDRKYYFSIWRWLRNRCNKKFNGKFVDLLDKTSNLIQLNKEHPVFPSTVIPSIEEIKYFNEYDKLLVSRWLRYYVGQWDVQLRFTIDNSANDSDVQIISIIYEVEKVAIAKALLYSPQLKVFSYDLPHSVGKHRFPLAQQDKEILIRKGRSVDFDLVLRPVPESPVCPRWQGCVLVETNRGVVLAGKLTLTTFNVYKGGILNKQK